MWGKGCSVTTYGIRIPVTVMNLVIAGFEADLSTCGGCEFRTPTMAGQEPRTSGGIDDQQQRSHQREKEDGRGKDCPGRPTLD